MGDSRVDGRSDVYSLACVVYEMLAGEPPFTGATGEAVAARKRSASIPSIARVRSSVPPSVDAVIARALVPVAADRYATAGEFGAALAGAFAAGADPDGSSRRQSGGATRAGAPRRMLRPRVVTLAAVTVALAAVAGWALSTRHAPAVRPSPAGGTRDTLALTLYRQAHAEIERRTEASVVRAVALLQRAIARDSHYVDAWADLTRALMFAQNWRFDVPGIPRAQLGDQAVLAGVRALEADSMSARAWIARATTLYLVDPTTRRGVAQALHRAIALDSSSADAWYYLGTHYEDVLDADSALTGYRRATAIRPTHPNALAFLALHYMWQRNSDSAIAWGDSAVRSNPTDILSRQARGMVLVQQGRLTEAEDDFAAVVALGQGPERVWGWTGLATVASRRHDRRGVDSLIAHAVADADTLRPTHHEAVYLAWMYVEAGQRGQALAVLERFTRPRHLHFQLHLLREFALDSLRREPRFIALLRSDTTQRR